MMLAFQGSRSLRGKRIKIYFKSWLKKQKNRDDIVGDFARDYIFDSKIHKRGIPNSLDCWVDYLESKEGCEEAMNALFNAWQEYKTETGEGKRI